jgi:hypothetical protein
MYEKEKLYFLFPVVGLVTVPLMSTEIPVILSSSKDEVKSK